jgi:hypothetical protein
MMTYQRALGGSGASTISASPPIDSYQHSSTTFLTTQLAR